MFVGNVANAGIIHTFVFDDIDEWDHVRLFEDGNSLSITFSDDTDYNNVQWSDILSFQYHFAVGTTYLIDSGFTATGDASTLFSERNGVVSLLFNTAGPQTYIYGYNSVLNTYGQITSGAGLSLYANIHLNQTVGNLSPFDEDGNVINYLAWAGLANQSDSKAYTSSVTVPEPSTFAIFMLALAGFMMRLFQVANKNNC